ncbi:MAG: PAS domain-containing protein [Bacteroidetes bacterium]|nr:PAS domain-containing protein [Bacteroidota bacterium]
MNNVLLNNLQQIFNAFSSGVLIEDKDRTILFTNSAFLEIFNIPKEYGDLKGANCIAVAAQAKGFFKDAAKFETDIEKIPDNGIETKEMIATADGRYFIRKYIPIYDNNVLCCHIWNYEEQTQLVKKEKETAKQKEFYHTILNEIPADIAIFSPDHRYLYLNKTAIKNDEVRDWLIGKTDYDYFEYRKKDPALADLRRAYFNRAKKTRSSVMWVDENSTADGKKDYVLRVFYPYINTSDEIEFVIGYGVNITQQKLQAQAVEAQKERFHTLIATLSDGVFQISFEGNMMYYNDAFLRAMAINRNAIGPKYTSNIMANVKADDKPSLYIAFDKLRLTGNAQKGIFRIINPENQSIHYIDYHIWRHYNEKDGNLVTGRLSDVTERVVNEQQMYQLIAKEKQLNTMKSNFIHITSHELRTPLSVIMSSAELLDMFEDMNDGETAIAVDRKTFTSGIVKEVSRITDILNELLVVGHIENNQVKYEPRTVDMRTYINDIVQEAYSPYSDGRKLNLAIDKNVSTADIDPKLMRHAITNLLNNAFKYSSNKPSPEMNIISESGILKISITDFGIGIPEEEIDNLFNSFFRASNVGNISGTGIGLMVVDHTVKAHGGKIQVLSTQGESTTFTISIPLKG